MSKYPIIIFEGIEASGKTTNFKIAANYLKKRRKSFIKLREPGGSIFSEKIRKLILNKKLNLNNKTDLLLFYAGRSENFEKIIKKNYKKKIILIDRFTDSTIAYQNRSNLNRYDKFKLKFYKKVQNGYEKISSNKSKYIKINSNTNTIKEVKRIIINKLEKLI